jgi:hypothetical protein
VSRHGVCAGETVGKITSTPVSPEAITMESARSKRTPSKRTCVAEVRRRAATCVETSAAETSPQYRNTSRRTRGRSPVTFRENATHVPKARAESSHQKRSGPFGSRYVRYAPPTTAAATNPR